MLSRFVSTRLGSSVQIVKRLQSSSSQYYPINDDVYGLSEDQKQVDRMDETD